MCLHLNWKIEGVTMFFLSYVNKISTLHKRLEGHQLLLFFSTFRNSLKNSFFSSSILFKSSNFFSSAFSLFSQYFSKKVSISLALE